MSNQTPAWHGPPDQYTSHLSNATFTALNAVINNANVPADAQTELRSSDSIGISNVSSGINVPAGSTTWITTNGTTYPADQPLPIINTPTPNPQWQSPLGNPYGGLGGNVQIGGSWDWQTQLQQRQLTEQDVKRIIEEVLKGNIKEKKEDDKSPNDLGMLMKQYGFPQLMIDIVMDALAQKWPVKKDPKERMEDLIVHDE